jgi:nitrogen fixation protein FixH
MAMTMQPTADAGRGRWIPWTFVGFFLVIFAVNGVLVWAALSSWTGLETTDSYERGLVYNRALKAEKEQVALGWRAGFGFDQTGARHGTLELRLQGRDATPVRGAKVDAEIVRPTTEGYDFDVALKEQAPGLYRAEIQAPLPGQWEARIAARARGETYRLSPRIYLRP